jgi:hypothetical protein
MKNRTWIIAGAVIIACISIAFLILWNFRTGITQIGNAVVYASANTSESQTDGFYGIAYKYTIGFDGQVTIAYRGTDQFFPQIPSNGIGGDVPNSYGAEMGLADQTQTELAFATATANDNGISQRRAA